MKFFATIAVGLLALATCSDARKGKGKGREDKGTIIRCMAENWKSGEAQIQACRDCFKAIGGDYLSETGLAAAKECTASYLPMENEACATQIAAVTPGNTEQLEDIIECFDETLETKNYERCLNDAEGDSEEKLTSGALCVLESWKYGMEYVKNATKAGGGRGRGRGRRPRGRGGKGKGKKKMMMKMLTIAHCDAANPDDETKQDQCEQCFKDAVKSLKHCSHWSCLVSSSGLAASQWAMVNIFIIIFFFPLPLPPLPLGLRPRPRPLPPPALVAFLTYSMPYFHDSRTQRAPEVNFSSESPSASFKHLS